MTLTIKCRLISNIEAAASEQTLDGCRWVYNYFRMKQLSVEDMQFALVELKESHSWLGNYHGKMLQMVVHQIDAARFALDTLRSSGRKTGKLKYSEEMHIHIQSIWIQDCKTWQYRFVMAIHWFCRPAALA